MSRVRFVMAVWVLQSFTNDWGIIARTFATADRTSWWLSRDVDDEQQQQEEDRFFLFF